MNLKFQHLVLQQLASGASFEMTPKAVAAATANAVSSTTTNWMDTTSNLSPQTVSSSSSSSVPSVPHLERRVAVTFLPGSSFADTIQACKHLRKQQQDNCNIIPIPTLCARAFRNKREFEEGLQRLQQQQDVGGQSSCHPVEEVYVLAGSRKEPIGDFRTSMDLLETGLLEQYGIRKIGLAGHPEGIPGVDSKELSMALSYKNEFAASTDADVYLVTQFCFEADPIVQWERRIRDEGNRLPIRLGVPGLASVSTLLRHAQNCGVGLSMRVLQQKGGSLTKLLQKPDKLLLDLAKAKVEDSESLIESLHWYPFGSLGKTVQYADSIANGLFGIDERGESLEIRVT